jgi:hypothetical protein
MTPAPLGVIPNWQPASTKVDYLRNCREGLEDYSERRLAKLLGWSRIRIHRAKLMAHFLIGFSSSFSPMAL